MSTFQVKLPSLGDDAGDKATVTFFFRGVGEEIKKGDDFVEMFTEKTAFTVPSPVAGKILSIEVGENDVVKVGDVLAVIDVPD